MPPGLTITRPLLFTLAISAAVAMPRSALAEDSIPTLVFAAGSARKELKPILNKLCERVVQGDLKGRYTRVLLLGQSSELGTSTAKMAPGTAADAATDLFNLLRTSDSELMACPRDAGSRVVDPPADVLFLDVTARTSNRVTIEIKQLRSLGTIAKTEVVKSRFAYGVDLTAPNDTEGLVGCIGWAFWEITGWLRPGGRCQQWGLPAEPASAADRDPKLAALAAPSLLQERPIVASKNAPEPGSGPGASWWRPKWVVPIGIGVVVTIGAIVYLHAVTAGSGSNERILSAPTER